MYYIDHNATTKMPEQVIAAMAQIQRDTFGNASSVHAEGAAARRTLEAARGSLARMIGAKPRELYFTSGGTESNIWALRGTVAPLRQGSMTPWAGVCSTAEHKSMITEAEAHLYPGQELLPVGENGLLDMASLEKGPVATGTTSIVSVILANNETGVIQDIQAISQTLKRHNSHHLMHTDACQAFGKISVDVDHLKVDLMSLSAHKLGGPKGVGALYVREGVEILPMLVGGHQEWDRRAGTENVPGAVGFQVAASLRHETLTEYQQITRECTDSLLGRLREGLDDRVQVNGGGVRRLPNTLNVGFPDVDSDALVLMLSGLGIEVSNGSACSSSSLEGSHVLKAMGQSDVESGSAIRFSFSTDIAAAELEIIADRVIWSVRSLQDLNEMPF